MTLQPNSSPTHPHDKIKSENYNFPLNFLTHEDKIKYEKIKANINSHPIPDPRVIAKELINNKFGIDSDEYIVAHFKKPESRTQGKPDEQITLTDAVMQALPDFSDQGIVSTFMMTGAAVLGGGEASPTLTQFAVGVLHSEGVGDFFKRLGNFVWTRSGPGYVYNTFFAEGNAFQVAGEHARPVDEAFGIYQANGKGFSNDNRSNLTPSKLAGALEAGDFGFGFGFGELPYIKKLKSELSAYWDKVKNDWPVMARYRFVLQARNARISQSEYELVMKGGAPGIPLDGPITMDQLRRSAVPDPSVEVERFDINGYSATDIVRFVQADKSEVVYIPGRQPAFESIGPGQSHDWLLRDVKEPARLHALLSHFSVYEKQDGPFYSGVVTTLKAAANGESLPVDSDKEVIRSDVFDDMLDQVEKHMSNDASMQTRTAWEGWRHTINKMALMLGPLMAPVQVGTGLDQAINGKTSEERKEGVIQTVDAVTAIIAMKAGKIGSGAKETNNAPKKLPNFKPPTRLPDGRSGYLAGPTKAPRLGRSEQLPIESELNPIHEGLPSETPTDVRTLRQDGYSIYDVESDHGIEHLIFDESTDTFVNIRTGKPWSSPAFKFGRVTPETLGSVDRSVQSGSSDTRPLYRIERDGRVKYYWFDEGTDEFTDYDTDSGSESSESDASLSKEPYPDSGSEASESGISMSEEPFQSDQSRYVLKHVKPRFPTYDPVNILGGISLPIENIEYRSFSDFDSTFNHTPTSGFPLTTGYHTENTKALNSNIIKFAITKNRITLPSGGGTIEINILKLANKETSTITPIDAYWAAPGRPVDIPINPTGSSPRVLFTGDFSGCSLIVDQINDETYRVYHVEGRKEDAQYNDSKIDHGLGYVGGMTPEDYSEHAKMNNVGGFAYMKYQEGKWHIVWQNLDMWQIGETAAVPSYFGRSPSLGNITLSGRAPRVLAMETRTLEPK